MLIVYVHNDGTGTEKVGNYDVTVKINTRTLWKGRVEGYQRKCGWKQLLKHIVSIAKETPCEK